MSTAPREPGDRAKSGEPANPAGSTSGDPAAQPELPAQRRPGGQPVSRYDLFLAVAADLDRVTTAYDAELMVSTMLGAAYALADSGRAAVLAETAEGLRRHLARRRTRVAALLRSVLATLAGQHDTRTADATGGSSATGGTGAARRGRPAPPPDPPAWLRHVGAVRPTGAFAFGDQDGKQTTYLAAFAYADTGEGGPEHVIAALVDHELGYAKDLFVAAPAGALLAQLEAAATTDPGMRLVEVDPGELRSAVERYLGATDDLPELPDGRTLTSDRAFVAHRLRQLPVAAEEPALTVVDFQAAPEAARVAAADEESLSFALKLIGEYRQSDPLSWNPDTVGDFLLDWLPARAVLDRADIEVLPNALSAWVRWAGRVSGLSPRAVAQNVAAVARHRAEFTRRARSGSHRSPAVRAMTQLLADGVDPGDERAVAEWLDDYNAREEAPPAG